MTLEAQKLALIEKIWVLQDSELIDILHKLVEKTAPFAAFLQPSSPMQKTASEAASSGQAAANESSPPATSSNPRQFGCGKGIFSNMAADFDETPPGFEDYMLQPS